MKKRKNALILSSLLTFSAISISTLVSCGDGINLPKGSPEFTIKNDSKIGTVKVLNKDLVELTDKAPLGEEIFIKVENIQEGYALDDVSVNNILLTFDDEVNAYKYLVTKDPFEIVVSYKTQIISRTLKVDVSNNPSIKSVEVFLGDNKEAEKNTKDYSIEVGTKVSLKITCNESARINSVKIGNVEVKIDNKTDLYSFIMPEENVNLKIETINAIPVKLDIDENTKLLTVNGETVKNSREIILPIGKPSVLKGQSIEGFELDLVGTSVINLETSAALGKNEVTYKVNGRDFEINILKVPDKELGINIRSKKPGKFKGEDFVGSWVAGYTSETSSDPILTITDDGKSTVNIYPNTSTLPVLASLTKEGDALVGTYKSAQRTYQAKILPLRDETGKLYALYLHFDGSRELRVVFVKDKLTEQVKFNYYKFDGSDSRLELVEYKDKQKAWIYASNNDAIITEVYDDSKTNKVYSFEEGKTYYLKTNSIYREIKFVEGEFLLSGIEQGTFTSEGKENIILDGYGNFSKGSLSGTYKYYDKRNLIILKSETTTLKYSIDINNKNYSDYIPKTNVLTGLTYEFTTVEVESSTASDYKLVFIDDTTVYVSDSNKQQIDEECNYEFNKTTGEITLYLPLVSNLGIDKVINAKFIKNYSQMQFISTTLVGGNDLIGVVAKITSVVGEFKNDNNDTLKLFDDGYILNNEEKVSYKTYFEDDNTVSIRSDTGAFKLDIINKKYSIIEPVDYSWLFNNTFGLTFLDEDSNPEVNIKYEIKITFGASFEGFMPLFQIDKYANEMGSDHSYENITLSDKRATVTYNPYNLTLTFTTKRNVVRATINATKQTITFIEDLNFAAQNKVFYVANKELVKLDLSK